MPYVLAGLGTTDFVPGNYTQVDFAQGPALLGSTTYGALLVGNMLSSGDATAAVIYGGPLSPLPLASEADCISRFGLGSELHRMFKAFRKKNTITPLYAIAVADPAGTAATRSHVVATTSTGTGVLTVWIGDVQVDTSFASGETAATIAARAVSNINSAALSKGLPVTATLSTATIVITARQTGPRGNWIRTAAAITPNVGTTLSNTASAFLASGATADDNTSALATMLASRFYYIVSAANDGTQLGALVAQVNTQALPVNGMLQSVFAASNDTSGNTTTIATTLNAARADLLALPTSDWEPPVMAADLAAIVAFYEAPFPFRCNFSLLGNDDATRAMWTMPAPRSGQYPTRATISAFLQNGVSPVGVNPNGTTYLVKLVTTRSLNGSTPDYRIRDHHKRTVCDRFSDDLKAKFAAQFTGKNLTNDPPPGVDLDTSDTQTVCPRVIKAAAVKLVRDYGRVLQNVDQIIAGTDYVRDTSPTTRASGTVPLQPIDILDQTATYIPQVA